MDEFIANTSKTVSTWTDRIATPLLDAGGAIFMPFVTPPEPFQPEAEEEDPLGQNDASDPRKKKPAMLRKEFETRCKQFREAAFNGTLHLPMEYAGVYNYCTKELHRAKAEEAGLREQFAKKYPTECYNVDTKGRVTVLPTWDLRGKKQLEFQREVIPPPDMEKGSPDEKAFEVKKKRAAKIRFDSKDEKKRKTMEDEIKNTLKRLKDLTSTSTALRSTTKLDSEGNPLPRGIIQQLQQKLDKEGAKFERTKSIAQYLIDEEGADINSANEDGFTALMLAARNGHYDTVKHLMEFPSLNLKKVNNAKCNAMHYAAMYAHKEVVQLLKHGVLAGATCDRKQKNEYGRVPRDNAEWEGLLLQEKKKEIWDKVYKQKMYMLVPELGPKDAPGLLDQFPYKMFGMRNPDSVEIPKEWEAGRWRLSKVPDPACKIDPMPESLFLQRWNSAAKRCGPKVNVEGPKAA